MEATIISEFDEQKITYGHLKKQGQGSVVNVFYEGSYLSIQTPLMNTFGISEYEGKWSLNLVFRESNGVKESELLLFQNVLNRLREKIINDIVEKKLYIEWLGVKDKWEKYNPEMKKELINQKIGKDFLKYSKSSEKYPPTMSLKVNKKKQENGFDLENEGDNLPSSSENGSVKLQLTVYKMIENYNGKQSSFLISDQSGEPIDFSNEVMDLLHFQSGQNKMRPTIYCIFNINIWVINSNIYIVPVCNQVLLNPIKVFNNKAKFNKRGLIDLEENDFIQSLEEQEQEETMDPETKKSKSAE